MKLSGIGQKDMRAFVRHLRKDHGVEATQTNACHVSLTAGWMNVASVRMSLTSSDGNQHRMVLKDLKRAGFVPCARCPQ